MTVQKRLRYKSEQGVVKRLAAPIFYDCDDVAKLDKALDCNSRNVGSNPTIVSHRLLVSAD